MANVFLVRHGQASLGKENYDDLSEIGHIQSETLGRYFKNLNLEFSHIITGSLTRHLQTANGITSSLLNAPSKIKSKDWNEFDFKTLVNCYLNSDLNTKGMPSDKKGYFIALKMAMLAWQKREISPSNMETWLDFEERVAAALDVLNKLERNDNALVVSSGGAISMAISLIYGLNAGQMIDLNLEIKNTSLSTFNIKKNRIVLSSFNTSPHIDVVSSPELVTYA